MKYSFKKFPIKNTLKLLVRNFISRRPVPILLSLNITHKCNARCPFCGFWRSEAADEMTLEQIEKILNDAYDLGCIVVTMTGGEPLLRKDLPMLLEHAKNTGLSTFLLTNGYLLSDRIKEMYRNLDVVSISIDYADTRHDKTRGIDNLFRKAILGIRLAQRLGVSTNINSIITNTHTVSDVEKLLRLAKTLDCGITFAPIFRVPILNEHTSQIGRLSEENEEMMIRDWNQIQRIAQRLLYHKAHEYRKTIQNTSAYLEMLRDQASFVCHPLSLQMGIAINGDVSSVCPIGLGGGHYLGNALRHDLKDIWYSERADRLREIFEKCGLSSTDKCYLLCVAEFSLLYHNPANLIDYVKRVF